MKPPGTGDASPSVAPTGSSPGELQLASALVPDLGATPSLPSAAASTPGISGASARHPASPTLPDFDPVSLTTLVTRMAGELFAIPPVPAPTYADAHRAPSAPLPSAPTSPSAPAIASVSSNPSSPFDSPLNFQSIDAGAQPFATPFDAGTLSFPLLDGVAIEPVNEGAVARQPEPPTPTLASTPFEIAPVTDGSIPTFPGAPLDAHALRQEFPILRETVHGK